MMRLNNSSQSSINSLKDKQLPPIPPQPVPSSPLAPSDPRRTEARRVSKSDISMSTPPTTPTSLSGATHQLSRVGSSGSTANSLNSISSNGVVHVTPNSSQDSEFLQVKTLRRKNFKKLSLDASPVKEAPVDDTESLLRIENSSLRQKRTNMRPAPVLNLKPDYRDSKPKVIHQTVSRTSSSSNTRLNVQQSSRNIDPDSQSSHDLIIDELSNLELAKKENPTSIFDDKPSQTVNQTPKPLNRKRQTVISSISPTKSSANSPSDLLESTNIFTENSSPIATTSSIKLNNNDLVTLKSLGAGNSGTVSKILHIPTQKTMAKKIIHIDSKTVIKTQIIRELRILHECQSPYIIEFYGAFVNNNNTIVICMEYCNCGSLDKILPLCEQKQFPIFVLKKLAYSILSGLTYLYTTHKIIHRDIKPSNVLMTHKGEFKLCDFGVSRELTNSLAMADTFVGTSMYMSPERIQGLNYGVKSDVWSMGLMLIELASGLPVWSDDDDGTDNSFAGNGGPEGILDLLQRIVNETPPTLTNKTNPKTNEPYDSSLCEFIDSCLIKNDSVRKSPWDLLQDENGFLSGVAKGTYDKEVKSWAKSVRKLHKDK